jgi:SAM-dependent methyltransferase
MSVTERELGSVPGKVSGRRAGEAAGMQTYPAHPVQGSVDPEELDRQIADMYRDVANGVKTDLHFPIGRPLAEALGYPPELLDRLPGEAVSSLAGVGYHFGLARLLAGERVLDVGCGSGMDVFAAAVQVGPRGSVAGSGMDVFAAAVQVGPRGSVAGVDITPEQLAKARRLASDGHIELRRARSEELPFETGSFDVVISNGVVNLSPDKRRVFAEAARVLRPGGRLALADIVTERQIGDPFAMPIELTAHTDTGARLVSTAEELAEQVAVRAAEHDRDGTYPFEAIDALKAANYFAAPIPVELGGLGVSSAHDLVVASSRLARGDASVAIGVNMHLVAVLNMVRRHDVAAAAGAERRARAFAGSLEQIVDDGVVLAAAISERGQDLTRPGTVATRTASGWRIDGRKMFCTMSPAATDLYVAVTYIDQDGVERYAYAMVPTNARGVIIHDDWDAMGMRASAATPSPLRASSCPTRACAEDSSPAIRCPTWSATCTPGCFTPRRRSVSPSRPTRSRAGASPAESTATAPAHADRRQRH